MQGFDGSTHEEPLTADAVVSKVESIMRMKTDFLSHSIMPLCGNLQSGTFLMH